MDESFQKAIKVWSDIGLESFQKVLDEQVSKIIDNQEQGAANRKELSTKTKEFRKLEDADKLEQIKSLLKLYQSEIDNLTNRTKYGESCFMNAYKVIGEAADPLPLLEASASSVEQVQQLSQLKEENAALQKTIAQTSDYDALKRKIADLEAKSSKAAADSASAKEREINALWDERERSWQLKEAELTSELSEVKQNYQVAQARLSSTSTSDPTETSLKLAEHNTTVRELERATLRVTQAEARSESLRQELEGVKSGSSLSIQKQEYEDRIASLETENTQLIQRYDSARVETQKITNENADKSNKIQLQLESAQKDLRQAQVVIAQQQDYEQIKKELQFLRSVEFGAEDNDDNEAKTGGSELEQILQNKNNKLNEELAGLRLKVQNYQTDHGKYNEEIAELSKQNQSYSALIQQLENDISTLQKHDNDTFSTISGWTAIPRRASPASSIMAGVRPARGPPPTDSAAVPPVDASVLNIVTQQRDRYKDKTLELEEDLRRTTNVITSQRKELEAVKQDNLELYERIRYVQAHGKDKDTKSDRFKSVYEDGLTSFQQFKSLETERALAGKGAFDRAVFVVLRKAITEDRFRYGSIAYIVAVHLMLVWALV